MLILLLMIGSEPFFTVIVFFFGGWHVCTWTVFHFDTCFWLLWSSPCHAAPCIQLICQLIAQLWGVRAFHNHVCGSKCNLKDKLIRQGLWIENIVLSQDLVIQWEWEFVSVNCFFPLSTPEVLMSPASECILQKSSLCIPSINMFWHLDFGRKKSS